MLGALVFLVFLGQMVFVHELGHLIAAKLCGVLVTDFCIGFKPIIRFRWRNGETLYAIGMIPFGGYIKILREKKDIVIPDDQQHRSLESKTRLQQIFVYASGALCNLVVASLIFTVLYAHGFHNPSYLKQSASLSQVCIPPTLSAPLPSHYPKPWPNVGDGIIKVNGIPVRSLSEASSHLKGKNDLITFRGNEARITQITLAKPSDICVKSEYIRSNLLMSPIAGIWQTAYYSWINMVGIPKAIFQSATNPKNASVAGPLGMYDIINGNLKEGVIVLLIILALFNIAIASINLLPCYPFDGGHILLAIIKRFYKPGEQLQNAYALCGIIFFGAIILIAFTGDILRRF